MLFHKAQRITEVGRAKLRRLRKEKTLRAISGSSETEINLTWGQIIFQLQLNHTRDCSKPLAMTLVLVSTLVITALKREVNQGFIQTD